MASVPITLRQGLGSPNDIRLDPVSNPDVVAQNIPIYLYGGLLNPNDIRVLDVSEPQGGGVVRTFELGVDGVADVAADLTAGSSISNFAVSITGGASVADALSVVRSLAASISGAAALADAIRVARGMAAGVSGNAALLDSLTEVLRFALAGTGQGSVAAALTVSGLTPAFYVLEAAAVSSNVVRVWLNIEPRHFSELSSDDATRRDAWSISVVTGVGRAPVVEEVENVQTAEAIAPGAWSVDLRTASRLVRGPGYQVVASGIVSTVGDALGAAPYDRALFEGIVGARDVRPRIPAQVSTGLDLRYDMFTGVFVFDARRDVDAQGGVEAIKKRIIRRVVSRPGGFYHLARYGVGLEVGKKFDQGRINELRRRIREQVLREEDVRDVSVSVARLAPSVLLVSIRALTTVGNVSLEFESSNGSIVVL